MGLSSALILEVDARADGQNASAGEFPLPVELPCFIVEFALFQEDAVLGPTDGPA